MSDARSEGESRSPDSATALRGLRVEADRLRGELAEATAELEARRRPWPVRLALRLDRVALRQRYLAGDLEPSEPALPDGIPRVEAAERTNLFELRRQLRQEQAALDTLDRQPTLRLAGVAASLVPSRNHTASHPAPPASEPSPDIVITVAAPTRRVAPGWGDWQFGRGLAAALRRRGVGAVVLPADEAAGGVGRSAAVQLVLRGLRPLPRSDGQVHALWVISHPELVTTAECDDADLVFVASDLFAETLRQRTRTPVEVLPQATDAAHFTPRPGDPGLAFPVTVVANTRHVLRPIVRDALSVGIRPALFGSGWRSLVDPALVVADHVSYERLPVLYSSAGVVLNDHWPTMRAWGFVSNRVFDVLACGAPVVSDHVPEIVTAVGDAVPMPSDPSRLRTVVEDVLADPGAARERAAEGRAVVLASHTFDRRAQQLLAELEDRDLFVGGPRRGAAGWQ